MNRLKFAVKPTVWVVTETLFHLKCQSNSDVLERFKNELKRGVTKIMRC